MQNLTEPLLGTYCVWNAPLVVAITAPALLDGPAVTVKGSVTVLVAFIADLLSVNSTQTAFPLLPSNTSPVV
jgi:hypothetical protein